MAEIPSPQASPRRYYLALGSRIAEARRERGMTQAKLAEQIRISRASLANMERGEQLVSAQILARLLVVLEKSAAELMPDPADAFDPAEVSPEIVKGWPEAPDVARIWMNKIVTGGGE
jgi:transcriptional regulator with XRE-family HTH domain